MTLEQPTITPAFAEAVGTGSGKSTGRKRPAPFSLRLTADERARLEKAAEDVPLGAYIKSRLFDGAALPRLPGKAAINDDTALAAVLAKLGASRLANNLNQIAKAANIGTLPVTPELSDELRQACAEIAIMKMTLMKALGIKER